MSINESLLQSFKLSIMLCGISLVLIVPNKNISGVVSNWMQILENVVFLELIRRKYRVTVGNIGKQEIDFICRKHDKTIYIQVSESILDENTREREFNPLEKISDNYPKYVLTLDDWDYSKNGITHLNVIDFLKNENIWKLNLLY